ncbi:hypothetical protein T4C_1139 [Trichinella pseudospiralis]|uniref:Uncharacterized protein n=1 Tax=Trichinella pseudospiralis TaxID=6337 RepID=A0A0V1KAT3_TRIPS|nr:hypothetical protein T4C_1139 [Trichinella pseudospiralis]
MDDAFAQLTGLQASVMEKHIKSLLFAVIVFFASLYLSEAKVLQACTELEATTGRNSMTSCLCRLQYLLNAINEEIQNLAFKLYINEETPSAVQSGGAMSKRKYEFLRIGK